MRSQLSDHVYGLKAAGQETRPYSPMSISPQQSGIDNDMPADFSNDFLGGTEFDELWPYLWGDDLSQVYLSGTEENLLNKHLLGVPLS